jgi:PAS domain S-box-containing protein
MRMRTRKNSQRLVFSDVEQTKLGQVLLEHGDVLVFKLDAGGKILFASENVLRALGLEPAGLEGRNFFEACAPKEQERLGKLILGKSPILPAYARVELLSKDGKLHTFYCTAARSAEDKSGMVLMARPAAEVAAGELAQAADAVLALFQNAPYAIFLHEPGLGRVLQANDLALALSGASREQLVGRDLLELFPRLGAAELGEGGLNVETVLRDRAGRLTPVSLSSSKVTLEGRERSLCFVRDLSRQKHAETERIASEARFKTALDRLLDGFCLIVPVLRGDVVSDFQFTYMNPSAREALLVPSGETDRSRLLSLFDKAAGATLLEIFAKVLKSGRDAQLDRVEVMRGGQPAVFALHACKHGEGVAITLRDETRRAQDELALASNERRLSALLANLPVGVLYKDVGTNKPPLANQYLRTLFGMNAHDDTSCFAKSGYLHDLAGNALLESELPTNVVLRTGKVYRNDRLELRVPGHAPCRLDFVVSPIIESGRVVALVAVITDVTTRTNLEAQLSQSQKMQALGTLAGGIAHDFNNVAQAISGSLELAKRSLTPEHKAFAGISAAQKAAARVTTLTAQLLSASSQRLEAVQTTGVGPLIEETASMLRSTIDKRISIETQVPPRVWAALLEPGRAQQCVLNLALNARDAIAGQGKITISAENVSLPSGHPQLEVESEPGDYVAVSVSDTGSGIAPEIINRVFEPFFSTKPIGKGTGLGLSVVYANMRLVGGWVKVASNSQGSTFTLYFRRGKRFSGTQPLLPDEQEDVTQSGTERVLVVDDEPEILEIACEILTDMGYYVETAQDGERAVERLRERHDIDLVLLDLTMPRQGGADTLKIIREEKLAPCVVVMSGFASGLDTESLIKLGADAFLPKPYSLSHLTKVVREQLDLHK